MNWELSRDALLRLLALKNPYAEYSRAIDRTLADDDLFRRIREEASTAHPIN